MKKYSLKKVTALILCAALIFQNFSLTYAFPSEAEEIALADDDSYAEATTETAISTSVKNTAKSSTQSAIMLDSQEDGYDISWYNDDKDSFEITNAEQLRGLAQLVNGTAVTSGAAITSGTAIEAKDFSGKTITLGADIDLENKEWIPVGTSDASKFNGCFNGNDKTIFGLYINRVGTNLGLFGYIDSTAEIKNLTVRGSVTETSAKGSNSTCVGGIVGYVNGAAKLTKLTNYSDVTMSRNYAGGIAGYVNGSAVLTGCHNYGNVSAFQYAGGIVGYSTSVTVSESN